MPIANDPEFKSFFFNNSSAFFRKCLYFEHGRQCKRKAIQAHSIQNNGVLDKLAVKGHVYVLKQKKPLSPNSELTFLRKGRNKATTFIGLGMAPEK